MACSLGRPLLAKTLVEIAERRCKHGSSWMWERNDQVRFEVSVGAGSDLKNLAPLRLGNLSATKKLIMRKLTIFQ